MPVVVGVRFKKAGKIYYFDPANLELPRGSKVVVETARGLEYGEVSIAPRDIDSEEIVQPLKPVVRIGTERDAEVAAENKRREKDAYAVALGRISAHGLDMNLVDVEYTFDNAKIVFYFTAEGRVDFRELVKDLASIFRTRIEMRQIGVRDEAKLIGGIGPCGRILCCTSFLGDFAPVSIRMAKDQNLSLNPSKISGLCGRLMCCLRYEQDTYEEAKKDPTLAPGYAPPQLTEEHVAGIEELDEERPSRGNSQKLARLASLQEEGTPPAWFERRTGGGADHGERQPPRRDRNQGAPPSRPERKERPGGQAPASIGPIRPQGALVPPVAARPPRVEVARVAERVPQPGSETPDGLGDAKRRRRRRRGSGTGATADQAQAKPVIQMQAGADTARSGKPMHHDEAVTSAEVRGDAARRRRRRRRRSGAGPEDAGGAGTD